MLNKQGNATRESIRDEKVGRKTRNVKHDLFEVGE